MSAWIEVPTKVTLLRVVTPLLGGVWSQATYRIESTPLPPDLEGSSEQQEDE